MCRFVHAGAWLGRRSAATRIASSLSSAHCPPTDSSSRNVRRMAQSPCEKIRSGRQRSNGDAIALDSKGVGKRCLGGKTPHSTPSHLVTTEDGTIEGRSQDCLRDKQSSRP